MIKPDRGVTVQRALRRGCRVVEAGSYSVSRVAGQWADSRWRARDVAGNGREEGQEKGRETGKGRRQAKQSLEAQKQRPSRRGDEVGK